MQNQNNIDNIYTIINRINQGGFSFIYLVRNENNHNQYVAKVRINENQQAFNNELQMTTIAFGLNNPNLIHFVHARLHLLIHAITIICFYSSGCI